ncbi:MAG: tonB-system energizer ExbB [Methyloligella sp. ZOD6]
MRQLVEKSVRLSLDAVALILLGLLLAFGCRAYGQEIEGSTARSAPPTISAGEPAQGDAIDRLPDDRFGRDTITSPAASAAGDEPSIPALGPASDASAPDLSPVGMFMAADWVVKGVMIGLLFASIATWSVWLAKTVEIACAKARAKHTNRIIETADSLPAANHELVDRGGPCAFMLRQATEEVAGASSPGGTAAGIRERVALQLERIQVQAGRRLSRGTGVLATIGSTAPFVGLFGTVWGIMNSFIGISESQTTNLAIVAPGIAEALLATAMGLIAAIPAVVINNFFARSVGHYQQLLADAVAATKRLVSRTLDMEAANAPPKKRASGRTKKNTKTEEVCA